MQLDTWELPTYENPDAAIHPSLLRPPHYYRETSLHLTKSEGGGGELYRSSSEHRRFAETTNTHLYSSSHPRPSLEQHRRTRSTADIRRGRSSADDVAVSRSQSSGDLFTRSRSSDKRRLRRRRSSRRHSSRRRSRSQSSTTSRTKPKTRSLESIIFGDDEQPSEQERGRGDEQERSIGRGNEVEEDWAALRSGRPNLVFTASDKESFTSPCSAIPVKFVRPDNTTTAPICDGSALEKLTNEIRKSILGCVETQRAACHDDEDDTELARRGRRRKKASLLNTMESAWQDSVDAVQEYCEANQDKLSRSLFDKFEALEVYAGPESLHKSLDRYID